MSEITAEMISRGAGPDPAAIAQRRAVNSRLRETREKLTSSTGESNVFDLELLRMFAQSRKGAKWLRWVVRPAFLLCVAITQNPRGSRGFIP